MRRRVRLDPADRDVSHDEADRVEIQLVHSRGIHLRERLLRPVVVRGLLSRSGRRVAELLLQGGKRVVRARNLTKRLDLGRAVVVVQLVDRVLHHERLLKRAHGLLIETRNALVVLIEQRDDIRSGIAVDEDLRLELRCHGLVEIDER